MVLKWVSYNKKINKFSFLKTKPPTTTKKKANQSGRRAAQRTSRNAQAPQGQTRSHRNTKETHRIPHTSIISTPTAITTTTTVNNSSSSNNNAFISHFRSPTIYKYTSTYQSTESGQQLGESEQHKQLQSARASAQSAPTKSHSNKDEHHALGLQSQLEYGGRIYAYAEFEREFRRGFECRTSKSGRHTNRSLAVLLFRLHDSILLLFGRE